MSTVRMILRRVPRSSVLCMGIVTGFRPSQTHRTWLPFGEHHDIPASSTHERIRLRKLLEAIGAFAAPFARPAGGVLSWPRAQTFPVSASRVHSTPPARKAQPPGEYNGADRLRKYR